MGVERGVPPPCLQGSGQVWVMGWGCVRGGVPPEESRKESLVKRVEGGSHWSHSLFSPFSLFRTGLGNNARYVGVGGWAQRQAGAEGSRTPSCASISLALEGRFWLCVHRIPSQSLLHRLHPSTSNSLFNLQNSQLTPTCPSP